MLYCSCDNLRRQLMALMVNNKAIELRRASIDQAIGALTLRKRRLLGRVSRERRIKGTGVEVVDYTGDVWCLSVPYDCFFVCRNGKVFLIGNCRSPKKTAEDMYTWWALSALGIQKMSSQCCRCPTSSVLL